MEACFIFFLQLICFHFMFENAACTQNFVWEYFHRPGKIAILGDEFHTKANTASQVDCVRRCISCPAVAFQENPRECRHYTRQNYTIVPMDDSGLGLWLSNKMALTAAQYADSRDMTYMEAKDLCELLGGRLATYRELSGARTEGFHLCRCGWLSDNTARFALHYDDPTCKHQQTPALHTCKIENNVGQRVYDTHYSAAYCNFA